MVVLGRGAVSYERGTPVVLGVGVQGLEFGGRVSNGMSDRVRRAHVQHFTPGEIVLIHFGFPATKVQI